LAIRYARQIGVGAEQAKPAEPVVGSLNVRGDSFPLQHPKRQ
jgi:hypothetical protein